MPNATSETGVGSIGANQPDGERSTSPGHEGESHATMDAKVQDKKPTVAKQYKTVPQTWTALPESRFRQVINHLESVLFEISADGHNVNIPDGHVTPARLQLWAEHLRAALKALTAGR